MNPVSIMLEESTGQSLFSEAFTREKSDMFTCRVVTFTSDSSIVTFPSSFPPVSRKVNLTDLPLTFRPFGLSSLFPFIADGGGGIGPSLGLG